MNRYKYTKKKNKKKLVNTNYPSFKKSDDDIYIYTKLGDRLDNLAYRFYKDSTLWWVIAKANDLSGDSMFVKSGMRLWIPKNLKTLQEDLKGLNE